MTQLDKLNQVLTSLGEAVFDDAHWPVTSALIDDACGLKGSALVVGRGHSQKDAQILFARFCYRGQRHEERERWYFDNYFPVDERVPRLPQLPDSDLIPIADLYTARELKTSAAYNRALPRGGYQNGLNVRLDGPDESHIIWTLADSTERGGWGSGQVETIKYLLPHIRQFAWLRHALVSAQALGASLAHLLDNRGVGVIHLDRRGRIVEANDRARGILRQGHGLRDQDGYLRALLPADNARLAELLANVLPTLGRQAVGGSMAVRYSPVLPGFTVHISPLSARQRDFGVRQVGALVLIRDPGSQPGLDARLVAEALGLTATESEVAVAVAEGREIGDIALAKQCKESTIRWHVKRILRKQGIPHQAGLVRLLLTTPGFMRSRD